MTRSKQKGAPHGLSGYQGGRRTKVVAPLRRSAAPSRASAVHERGPGSIPPKIVQSPAGPIEAKTEASYPIEAPGAVTSSPATCYPRDRSGGDCVLSSSWPETHEDNDRGAHRCDETPQPTHQQDGRGADGGEHRPEPEPVKSLESHGVASQPSKVAGPSNPTALDKVLSPQEGNGPSSDDHDAHHHEPERVGLVVAHTPFEAPTGQETPAAGGAPAQPEPEQPGEHICHTQPPFEASGEKSSRGASAHGDGLCASTPRLPDDSVAEQASPAPQGDPLRAVDPTASVCTACGCELPQRGLCAQCEADWHGPPVAVEPLDRRTFNELCLIGRAADAAAAEVRAVLNAPRTHWCSHCGRDLSQNAEWCMHCGRDVGSGRGSKCAADEPASPASGSVAPSGDAPEGAASALGKIGSYSSARENQGVPESAACGPEKPPERTEPTELRTQPTGQVPCPHCDDTSCENGCHCTTCGGLHAVAAYTCEQCGGSSARLHRTTRRGSTEDRPWLCDTCWSREICGPRWESVNAFCRRCARLVDCGLRKAGFRCEEATAQAGGSGEHVYASGVKYRSETDEDRAAVADLADSIMSSTEKPAPRTPINVMPERPLVTALDRMCAWLEHSELTADQSRLCESLLKKLQVCSASVMNAQLRRSWKPRDAS